MPEHGPKNQDLSAKQEKIMREVVLEEMKAGYERYKKDPRNRPISLNEYIAGNMNNFWLNIRRSSGKSYWDERMSEKYKSQSRRQSSEEVHRILSKKEDPERWIADDMKGHSEKGWNVTKKDFSDEVDRAITESGVEREKLIQYIDSRYEENALDIDPNKEVELLFPVYVKMREWGYAHGDLK